jgi:hypothetical protein
MGGGVIKLSFHTEARIIFWMFIGLAALMVFMGCFIYSEIKEHSDKMGWKWDDPDEPHRVYEWRKMREAERSKP